MATIPPRDGDYRRLAAFSRRRFLAALTLGGSGLFLAACGGSATATPAKPTAAPAATTASTATTSTAASTSVVATPATPVATAISAASPVAHATPGAASTALGQLLGKVPKIAGLPGQNGIWFADVAQQKRNYGFTDITSVEAFKALTQEQAQRFNNTVGRLPHADTAGQQYAALPDWQANLGFTFWQIEREIMAGDPPGVWSRLEGAFDRATIEQALTGKGYQPVSYHGQAYLSRYADFAVQLSDPLSKLVLARYNRVYLADQAIEPAAATALVQAGIDAATRQIPTFASNPDYAALAAALGPVVGVIILPGDQLYQQTAPAPSRAPATPTRATNQPKLHPYRLVGLGLLDDGKTHTALIALLYSDAATAQADAPVLHQRVNDYELLATRQPLRERLAPGEPRVVPTGDRATLIQPFNVGDEANLGFLIQLLQRRDLAFLGE
ncbi:MAG: hypothetical protein ACTHMR_18405 [Thermomicrobiales bacterium]